MSPRTDAGRALLATRHYAGSWYESNGRTHLAEAILAIEQEAMSLETAAWLAEGEDEAVALDVEMLTVAVEALERLGERHHALSDDHNPGSVFQMRPAFKGLSECDDYTCVEARAALARLTDEARRPDEDLLIEHTMVEHDR